MFPIAPVVDELLHTPHGRVEDERVTDHQHAAGGLGRIDDLVALGDGERQRLLAEDMLSGLERFQRQRGVRRASESRR